MSMYRRLRKHLTGFTLLLLCVVVSVQATAATVKPGITLISENETIYLGDSVIIDVEAVGLLEPLDVSALFKFADLLRETTGTRIAVVDGRVVEVKLRRMEFIPKQEGRVFFGPLSGESFLGTATSNTLVIDVQPAADTHWEPDTDDLQIEVALDWDTSPTGTNNNPKLYVGQRLVATVELKHRYPIFEEQLTLPAFEGFDVLVEFKERRTIEALDDENSWRVTAWRYHLFPQRSGSLSISGVQWTGTSVKSRTQRSAFSRQSTESILTIKPSTQNNEWWLPATALSLSDQWSKDPRELSAGDEIIRTITLDAENVLASHLPTITPLESRALRSTLIAQTRDQQLTNGTVQASATFTYRMVAQSPIPVFLDTVRVPWFNTKENTSKEAIIPARRINVGLPNRADLLAEIALQDNWWDRISFKVTNGKIDSIPWKLSFTSLLLICSAMGIREWVHRRRESKRLGLGRGGNHLPDL